MCNTLLYDPDYSLPPIVRIIAEHRHTQKMYLCESIMHHRVKGFELPLKDQYGALTSWAEEDYGLKVAGEYTVTVLEDGLMTKQYDLSLYLNR